MSEMVDRVAEAIRTYGVRIRWPSHRYELIKCDAWDEPIKGGLSYEEADQEAARLNSHAAIAAMREPTPEMIEAGCCELSRFRHDESNWEEVAASIWHAMADEALAHEPATPAPAEKDTVTK